MWNEKITGRYDIKESDQWSERWLSAVMGIYTKQTLKELLKQSMWVKSGEKTIREDWGLGSRIVWGTMWMRERHYNGENFSSPVCCWGGKATIAEKMS